MVFVVHYKLHLVNTFLQWKHCFLQQLMKGVETSVCQNKQWRRLTLVDSDILNENDVLLPPKKYVLIENRTVDLILYVSYLEGLHKICTNTCWLLKGVETGYSRIVSVFCYWTFQAFYVCCLFCSIWYFYSNIELKSLAKK